MMIMLITLIMMIMIMIIVISQAGDAASGAPAQTPGDSLLIVVDIIL